MIKLTGIIGLKPLTESEDDKYVHIGYGKYKQKGKEKDSNAPTFKKDDSGKYVPTKGDKAAKGGDSAADAKEKPKVNIFDKPSPEDSTGGRAGDPQVNKATRKLASKYGITPSKMGREEYQKAMGQAAVEALTDSNFHSEARALVAALEGKPELAQNPADRDDYKSYTDPGYEDWVKTTAWGSEYMDHSEEVGEFARSVASESGWDGIDAIDGIAFELKMNGFKDLAAKIQGAVNESKLSLKNIVIEGKAEKIAKHVKDGYGWIDADYVLDNPHFNLKNDAERIEVLSKLAKMGILVDVDKLNGSDVDLEKSEIPRNAFMDQRDVVKKYSKMVKSRYDETLEEGAGKPAFGIAALTGTRPDAVQKFMDEHGLDEKKLFAYIKKGKIKERMNFITALVGNPGNKYQKDIIQNFKK